MARSHLPDSQGSQFFIMTQRAPHLDGEYAAFGKVVDGMDEVDKIVSSDRDYNDKPYKDQVMVRVTVDTFGKEYDAPNKM